MNPFRWLARAFMARIGWVGAGLLLLALGFDAKAQTCTAPQVPKYTVNAVSTTPFAGFVPSPLSSATVGSVFYSAAEMASTFVGSSDATNIGCPSTGTSRHWYQKKEGDYTLTSNSFAQRYIRRRTDCSGVTTVQQDPATFTLNLSTTCDTPPPPPSCDTPPNTRIGWAESGSPASACIDNCRLELKDGIDFGLGGPVPQFYSTTGAVCEPADPEPTLEPEEFLCEGEVCASSETGEVTDNTDPLLPGETVEEIDQQGCVTTASGGVFCLVDYEGPEIPDSGVPGTNATPDQTIEVPPPLNGNDDGDPTPVNYYNPTTVNNSTNVGTGDPDGEGEDSSGECEPGDTTCEGGGRGDGRVSGPGGTTQSFGDATEAFMGALGDSPMGQLGQGFASAIPDGGTCPTATFDALGEGFTIEAHCTILDQYYATIRAMFALFWLGLGALIILRA